MSRTLTPGKVWSTQEEKRLRSLYPVTPTPELARIFARSVKAVRSRAKLIGVVKAVGYGGRHDWSPREDKLLRSLFPHVATKKLAVRMKLPICAVQNRANHFGLHKTEKYLASPEACRLRRGDNIGAAYRFKKGQIPPNKGSRRPGWAPGRMAETQFKKGQAPPNRMPMWSFRWVDGYLMLKTGAPTPMPTRGWEYVHKLIWEQANGPLPDWRVARLWWKDGDHGNCSLANLELVTCAEHMRRTTIHNLPPDLRQVILLGGALKRVIRRKLGNGEEQNVRSA